jgi:hypothetical protein
MLHVDIARLTRLRSGTIRPIEIAAPTTFTCTV